MLSVVEHFSKMRLQFSQFMSAFAALRLIRWAYTKLRELAGLLPVSVDDDGGVGSDVREDELCPPSRCQNPKIGTLKLKTTNMVKQKG